MNIIKVILFYFFVLTSFACDSAETKRNTADIDSKTNALTSSINSWNGSNAGTIPVRNAAKALENSVNSAIQSLSNKSICSDSECTVLSYTSNTIVSDICKAINALEAFSSRTQDNWYKESAARLKKLAQSYFASCQRVCPNQRQTFASASTQVSNNCAKPTGPPIDAAARLAVRDCLQCDPRISLRDIDNKTRALTSSVNGWDGTAAGAGSVRSAEKALEDAIDFGTGELLDEDPRSNADCVSYASYVKGTLVPDLCASADAIYRRRADFQNAGLAGFVRDAAGRLRTKSKAYLSQLRRICPQEATGLNSEAGKIDQCFGRVGTAAAAARSSIADRDVAETNRNVKSCESACKNLLSAINGWNGTPPGAIAINNAESALENCIKTATSDLSDETTASSADSLAKKQQFQSAGLYNTVKSALARLRSLSATYADGLIKIASSDQKSNGQAAKSRIDAMFAKAQQSFP